MTARVSGERFVAVLCLAMLAAAQEIDTVILKSDQPRGTFLDEIEDPGERRAFEVLATLREPNERLRRATEFLSRYPASWLVSRALEVRAKAAIDLDRFESALSDGAASLKIYPENVLLLGPLANVAVHVGRNAEARRYAAMTLECLDRFAKPASIADRDWPALEADLRSSALSALGRVELNEGRASAAAGKLEQALRAKPADAQAAFLLGLTYLDSKRREEGLRWLARVARAPGPLQQRAIQELRSAGDRRDPATIHEPKPLAVQASRAKTQPGSYAGSAACRQCHSEQFEAWRHTGMAKMFRRYQPEIVAGDFGGKELKGADGEVLARMKKQDGRPVFELRSPGGGWTRYAVDYLIGSKWQQGYVTRGADGGLHVLPIQFNFERARWLNYWELIDPPHSVRADVSRFRAEGPATSYTRNCAPCHTSQLRAVPGPEKALEAAVFQEAGVNCEMCHGPSAEHARKPAVLPISFSRAPAREAVAVCAQCHMQSAMRELGPGGEINYAGAGRFPPDLKSRPFDQFLRRAFYKDGRFRETTFITEALERSRCFREGGASCGSCHHPHPKDAASNPVSLKFRDDPDQRCLQCHKALRTNPEKHTRHAVASTGSRCEACHMPRIMNALLFKAGNHVIDDVPNAAMTRQFGAAESPNACLLCHTDKDLPWLESQLSHWR